MAKDIAYLQAHHGGEWRPVEPVQVFVRRSSGRIDGDWYTVAYDAQHETYCVRKSDGTLKTLPPADLTALNANVVLTHRGRADKPSAGAKPEELLKGTHDAVAALGLDEQLQAGFVEKMRMIADVVATELDRREPEVGLDALRDVSMVTGDNVDLTLPGTLRSIANPLNLAVLRGSFDRVFAAARPFVAAVFEREMFIPLMRAIHRSPALVQEMETMLLEAVLLKAHRRRQISG